MSLPLHTSFWLYVILRTSSLPRPTNFPPLGCCFIFVVAPGRHATTGRMVPRLPQALGLARPSPQ